MQSLDLSHSYACAFSASADADKPIEPSPSLSRLLVTLSTVFFSVISTQPR